MKPVELAKRLGIQLWTPAYRKGKGVAMKQTDDGSWINLGDLPALASPQPNNEQRRELVHRAVADWSDQPECDKLASHEVEEITDAVVAALSPGSGA